MLKSGENEWSNGTPVEGIYGNGGVENTDGRQILMRSLAALHIHAMKIHRLLCNDRRRRPTGWIKSTLDYRLTLIPIPDTPDFNPSFSKVQRFR